MSKIGIFFGTDTGTTRKISKLIAKELGELAAKPLNINRAEPDALTAYEYLILGTPTLGEGQLPGLSSDCQTDSWEEYMDNFEELDLTGKKVALFGLGDQVNYPNEFVDALGELYDAVAETGAEMLGRWSVEGYEYEASCAEDGEEFVGLVIDNDNQSDKNAARVSQWVEQVLAEMELEALPA
ncbi:flavodoxin [Echinimonas agarilytica]|uniref:Flavodoxin n=1 Tax=Echinimonas agarilytica TaxID=1215918 RepID=A0AA41W8T5_9GAMM|nr:flavodoxin [Echinimonas agarilytica]MCM2680436.1 flavodoxin [Echinimonas agarilytica]